MFVRKMLRILLFLILLAMGAVMFVVVSSVFIPLCILSVAMLVVFLMYSKI